MEVYIICVYDLHKSTEDYVVSSEGYSKYEDAVKFIEGRYGNPKFDKHYNGWIAESVRSTTTLYRIKAITVK